MTIDEARYLENGDYVLYRGLKYKVLHTKEQRDAHTNEIYMIIKCVHGNETIWLSNKLVNFTDPYSECTYKLRANYYFD